MACDSFPEVVEDPRREILGRIMLSPVLSPRGFEKAVEALPAHLLGELVEVCLKGVVDETAAK